jgi:hypothetical protein
MGLEAALSYESLDGDFAIPGGRMDRVAYVIAFVLVYCDTRLRHDLGFSQSRILLLCYSIVYTTIT